MGGSSTFGFEMNNGSVCYVIFNDYYLLDIILPVFQKGKVYEFSDEMMKETIIAHSVEDYFSEKNYHDEDSKVRGLYKLDGTFIYKFWDDKGHYFILS